MKVMKVMKVDECKYAFHLHNVYFRSLLFAFFCLQIFLIVTFVGFDLCEIEMEIRALLFEHITLNSVVMFCFLFLFLLFFF